MIEQKRILATTIPGPASQAMHARKTAAVSAGVSTGLPVYVVEGSGGIVRDVDGNQLIDFGSGIAVTTVGNGNQRVIDAVTEQINAFTHTCFMVTPYDVYVEVCEKLNALTPGEHEKRTALFNSGAEAVENAVKIARHATGRTAVVAFDHGYHGRTNLTMGLTAKNMPYKDGFGPFASELYRVPMAYPFRWPGGAEACAADALRTVTDQIHAQVGEKNCAAVIIEPIQGEGGFIVPPDGFLPGAGRLVPGARNPAHRGRGAVGLLPHRRLVRLRPRGRGARPHHHRQGHRRWHAPRGCHRPGRAHGCRPPRRPRWHVRRQPRGVRGGPGLDRDDGGGRPRGTSPRDRRDPHRAARPAGGQVRGDRRGPGPRRDDRHGARQRPRDKGAAAALAAAVNRACHERGLITLTCGTYGNVFRFLPPLSISDDLLHEGIDVLEEAFAASVS